MEGGGLRFVTAGEIMDMQSPNYYSEQWTWTAKTTDAGTAGQIGINAASSWNDATALNLNELTANNRNMRVALQLLFIKGNTVYLQHKSDNTRYAVYLISGAPVDNAGWWMFPVTYQQGAGPIFTGNTTVYVTVFTTLIPLQ